MTKQHTHLLHPADHYDEEGHGVLECASDCDEGKLISTMVETSLGQKQCWVCGEYEGES